MACPDAFSKQTEKSPRFRHSLKLILIYFHSQSEICDHIKSTVEKIQERSQCCIHILRLTLQTHL